MKKILRHFRGIFKLMIMIIAFFVITIPVMIYIAIKGKKIITVDEDELTKLN